MDDRRTISPEETLLPPLTQQDRHPSAPQLANLLTAESSSSGNKPDVMLTEEVCVCVGVCLCVHLRFVCVHLVCVFVGVCLHVCVCELVCVNLHLCV